MHIIKISVFSLYFYAQFAYFIDNFKSMAYEDWLKNWEFRREDGFFFFPV